MSYTTYTVTIILQKVHIERIKNKNISLTLARADLIDHLASGNKVYKLTPNIEWAKEQGYTKVLSFGGAFSNHIHALALTAKKHHLKSSGIIRGEKEYINNPTLRDAVAAGMQIEFVTREEYRRRDDAGYLKDLQLRYPDTLIIPEGGSSQLAIQGCKKLADQINAKQKNDILAVACGTGATMSGIVCGLKNKQQAIGYAVLKDESLLERVKNFVTEEGVNTDSYHVEDASFGGYAKLSEELLDFIFEWLDETGVLLDPIYTSKMCMRLVQQIKLGEFKAETSITIIHTGGLQGWRGMKRRVIKLKGAQAWDKIQQALDQSSRDMGY